MDESPASRGTSLTPELIKDLTVAISKQGWKPEELQLKRREVRYTRHSLWLHAVTAIATTIAATAAAFAAYFAGSAVNVAQTGIDRQTKEARFSAAVQALGGNQPAERVAGAIMLRRNVEDRLASAQNAHEQLDAFNLYLTTKDILENYLKTPVESLSSTTPAAPPAVTASGQNPLVGEPEARPGRLFPSREHVYAAQQLAGLLTKANQDLVHRFNNTRNVSVDLAYVELSGESWPEVDFSWLDGKYFYGIDLRDADLTGSKWGNAELSAASFQCSNLASGKLSRARLQGAKLQHANLQNADLRSADLRGADLTGAYVDGARFDGAQLDGAATNGMIGASVGDGKLLKGNPKREEFDVKRCINNGWDQ